MQLVEEYRKLEMRKNGAVQNEIVHVLCTFAAENLLGQPFLKLSSLAEA
jgi:hypothetical protein